MGHVCLKSVLKTSHSLLLMGNRTSHAGFPLGSVILVGPQFGAFSSIQIDVVFFLGGGSISCGTSLLLG